MFLAHSLNDRGYGHDLVEHLSSVAEMARRFSELFGAGDLAYYEGLWHDLGKFHPRFQEYLERCNAGEVVPVKGRPDHKASGSLLASQHLGIGALLIQGHHGGLKAPEGDPGAFKNWLRERLQNPATKEALALAEKALPNLIPPNNPSMPDYIRKDPLAAELFLRMVFSSLVDADFLDTERHFHPDMAEQRAVEVLMPELWERFQKDQGQFVSLPSTLVFKARREVYEACIRAAEEPPGLFRLTVPTGGGKTRSAMAFALQHAIRHGQNRIVVAVPFISITEQTAEEYQKIFGNDAAGRPIVLEHHSAVEEREADTEDFRKAQVSNRLAAENWDAPIIVTTTVQLFESLFANIPSRCRKLHRLANSIIILDEAQALPAHLLRPILDVLKQLCTHYKTTVVLSTATQPSFDSIAEFASLQAKEIVPDAPQLFHILRRVNYEWLLDSPLGWEEVAAALRSDKQSLAVVNTKKDALALLNALGDSEALHLSTLLCGAHRKSVIQTVKSRLSTHEPCMLVSTQVIEAGVDLDFPLVMRAIGPLDSIIQSAGRCNREGKLGPAGGKVIVFQPKKGGMPRGQYTIASGITGALLSSANLEPDTADAAEEYFHRLYDTLRLQGLDSKGIQDLRRRLDYPKVAQEFHMIDDDTESIAITSYGTPEEREKVEHFLGQLRSGFPNTRLLLRQLQPYLVSVRTHELQRYQKWVEPIRPGLYKWLGGYDQVRGLKLEGLSVEEMVV